MVRTPAAVGVGFFSELVLGFFRNTNFRNKFGLFGNGFSEKEPYFWYFLRKPINLNRFEVKDYQDYRGL
jgi:hypothetical protein